MNLYGIARTEDLVGKYERSSSTIVSSGVGDGEGDNARILIEGFAPSSEVADELADAEL